MTTLSPAAIRVLDVLCRLQAPASMNRLAYELQLPTRILEDATKELRKANLAAKTPGGHAGTCRYTLASESIPDSAFIPEQEHHDGR